MDGPAANSLPPPPSAPPTEPRPQHSQVTSPPKPESPANNSVNRLFSLIFLAVFAVAIAADIYIIYLVISLVIFAYSGSNDPTSINGLAFPIAIFIYIVIGTPAAAVTCLAFFGYRKTRQRTQDTSKRFNT